MRRVREVREVREMRTVWSTPCFLTRHGCPDRRRTRLLSTGARTAEGVHGNYCQARVQGRSQISRRLPGRGSIGVIKHRGRVQASDAPGIRQVSRVLDVVDRRDSASCPRREIERLHIRTRGSRLSAARQAIERRCLAAPALFAGQPGCAPRIASSSGVAPRAHFAPRAKRVALIGRSSWAARAEREDCLATCLSFVDPTVAVSRRT